MKVLFLRDARPYFLLFAVCAPIAAVCTLLAFFVVPETLLALQILLGALALLAGAALVIGPPLIAVFRFWGIFSQPYRIYELTLPVSCRVQLALRFLLAFGFLVAGAVIFLACTLALVQLVDLVSLVGASAEDIFSAVYGFLSSEPILVPEVVLLLLLMAVFDLAFLFAICAMGQYMPASRGVTAVLLYFLMTIVVFPALSNYLLLPVFLLIGAWSLPFAGLVGILFYALLDWLLLWFVYMTLSRRMNLR